VEVAPVVVVVVLAALEELVVLQLLVLVVLVFNFLHHLEIQYHLQVQQVVVWVCLDHQDHIGLLVVEEEVLGHQQQEPVEVLVDRLLAVEMALMYQLRHHLELQTLVEEEVQLDMILQAGLYMVVPVVPVS
jgi:hypothetical protein